MNPEKRDLGITLVLAAVLLFSTSYLAQCASTRQPAPTTEPAAALSAPSQAPEAETERERAGGANEEDNEERAKVQGVAHAIQTIAADPELRRTYGFPP